MKRLVVFTFILLFVATSSFAFEKELEKPIKVNFLKFYKKLLLTLKTVIAAQNKLGQAVVAYGSNSREKENTLDLKIDAMTRQIAVITNNFDIFKSLNEKRLKEERDLILKRAEFNALIAQHSSFKAGVSLFGSASFILSKNDAIPFGGIGINIRWLRSYYAFDFVAGSSLSLIDPSFYWTVASSFLVYKKEYVGYGPVLAIADGKNYFSVSGGTKIDFSIFKNTDLWVLSAFGISEFKEDSTFSYSANLTMGLSYFIF